MATSKHDLGSFWFDVYSENYLPSSFNIARRPPLTAFSTPGFYAPKSHPSYIPTKPDPVYVSSDSAPSTPGRIAVKRTSSGFSVPDSPPVKRFKKLAHEDKENILKISSSKLNIIGDVQPVRSIHDKTFNDLALVSIFSLALLVSL